MTTKTAESPTLGWTDAWLLLGALALVFAPTAFIWLFGFANVP